MTPQPCEREKDICMLSVYLYVCVCIHIYIYTCVCMYVCMHGCMYVCLYACMSLFLARFLWHITLLATTTNSSRHQRELHVHRNRTTACPLPEHVFMRSLARPPHVVSDSSRSRRTMPMELPTVNCCLQMLMPQSSSERRLTRNKIKRVFSISRSKIQKRLPVFSQSGCGCRRRSVPGATMKQEYICKANESEVKPPANTTFMRFVSM